MEGPGIAWRTRRRAVAGRRRTKAAPRSLGLSVRRRRTGLGGRRIATRFASSVARDPRPAGQGAGAARSRREDAWGRREDAWGRREDAWGRRESRGRGSRRGVARTCRDLPMRRRDGLRLVGWRLEIGFFGAGPAELSPQFVIAVGHCLPPPDVVPCGFRPLSSINYIAACAADAATPVRRKFVSKHHGRMPTRPEGSSDERRRVGAARGPTGFVHICARETDTQSTAGGAEPCSS